MIDCFLVESAVISLDLSPLHDLLVTTHVDELGLYLWSNVTLFQRNPYLPALDPNFDPQQVTKVPTAKSIFGWCVCGCSVRVCVFVCVVCVCMHVGVV